MGSVSPAYRFVNGHMQDVHKNREIIPAPKNKTISIRIPIVYISA